MKYQKLFLATVLFLGMAAVVYANGEGETDLVPSDAPHSSPCSTCEEARAIANQYKTEFTPPVETKINDSSNQNVPMVKPAN
jgi:hypothetical protein